MKTTNIFFVVAVLSFQMLCFAQRNPNVIKKNLKATALEDKKVLYEITLHHISVAEESRNRIDNDDCKKTWGRIKVFFYELDENGQLDTHKRIQTDININDEMIFLKDRLDGPYQSKSYYQSGGDINDTEFIKKIFVRVPERLVKNKKVVALVTYVIYTAHKDNDLASFDHLSMTSSKSDTFYLEDVSTKTEVIQSVTNGSYEICYGQICNERITADDYHRIWLYFTVKRKD